MRKKIILRLSSNPRKYLPIQVMYKNTKQLSGKAFSPEILEKVYPHCFFAI